MRPQFDRWKEAAILNYPKMHAVWLILIEEFCDTADIHAAMKDAAYEIDWTAMDINCTMKHLYEEGRAKLMRRGQ